MSFLPTRFSSFVLAGLIGLGGITLGPTGSVEEAFAQSRKDEKKREVLDYKAFERDKNRELYGELANEKRQEAIAQLKKILKEQTLAPDIKAEMLMRLAEYYFEQSKYEYNLEMKDHDKLYEKWFNLPEAQQKKTPQPKLETPRATAFTKKAIENYRGILKNYPSYPRADEALFFLSFMLNDIGSEKESLENYNKLVKTYPKSAFVPDSYNAIGEYYFNNNNAYKALQSYKKAAQFKDSKIYTFALYKMGWCYFNVGEFRTAIETMTTVIDETNRKAAEGTAAEGISLKEEALRDLVVFYSEEGDLEEAKATFRKYGEDRYYRKLLSRLGKIYLDQGKNELAIQTYRELIAENPFATDNPEHQNEIIQAFWKRDRFDEANEEINKLVDTYGKTSRWEQENVEDKKAVKEATRIIEKNLRNVAIDSHQQALKRKSAKLLLLAEENYKRYLDYFEKGHKTYEVRYWYAEVLYKLKKYDLATNEYEATVKADAKGKFLKDAAENAVFSVDEYLKPIRSKLDKEAKKAIAKAKREGEGTAKYAEVDLHEWEQRLVDACDNYSKALPDDDKTERFLYKAALLLHDRNHYNESNERFLTLIRKNPKSRTSEEGVHTILSSYTKIENWTKLNEVAREFHGNPDIGNTKKFKGELLNIYQRATFKIAEGFAAEGKKKEAADGFKGFYDEFEKSDVRDIALYNAAYWYGETGDKARTITLRREFAEKFEKPAGKDARDMGLYEKTLALLGDHYSSIADYDQSAEFFRRLWDANPKFADDGFTPSIDGLYNAALFHESAGRIDEAATNFNDYIAAIEDKAEKLVIRLRIADLYSGAGRADEARTVYKAIYSDKALQSEAFDQVLEAWVKYGRLLDERKMQVSHYSEGLKMFDAKSKNLGGEAKARFWAAEMRFNLLEDTFAEYSVIAMSEDTKKASKALKEKSSKVPQLEKAYVNILNLKQGSWGIAALYRIGTVYGDFADKLQTAPCPPKLDEDQCQIYSFGLQDKAYPLIDKAVEAFTNARNKSYELGLYTEFTEKALAELSRLRPEEYPPSAELLPTPDYTSNPYVTADFVE